MRIILLREKHILIKMNVYIFYFHFTLDIILGDRCDRKTPKITILFEENLIFDWLNLVKLLLLEEMLVLTSY